MKKYIFILVLLFIASWAMAVQTQYQEPNLARGNTLMTQGHSFFLDPANGNDDYNGRSINKPRKTFANAYKLLTANQNDVLYYVAGATALTSTCTLTMSKAYTHFVGICAETQEGQRVRVYATALSSVTPLISVTADGCSIRNIFFDSSVDSAGALICGYVTGDFCYFENVCFRGQGNADQNVASAYSLELDGAVSCTFKNCVIGNSSYAKTAGAALAFDTAAARNKFIDCLIYSKIGHASTHPLVKVIDGSAITDITWFKNCEFQYTSESKAYSGTSVFSIPATTGTIVLDSCIGISGSTVDILWDSNTRGLLSINMSSPTQTGSYGKASE